MRDAAIVGRRFVSSDVLAIDAPRVAAAIEAGIREMVFRQLRTVAGGAGGIGGMSVSRLTFMRRVAKVARRDIAPITVVQWALGHVPLAPVRFGILCFLELDRVPYVRSSWLRGPGHVRPATPDDLEGPTGCLSRPT